MNRDTPTEEKREWIERTLLELRDGYGSIAAVAELRSLLMEDQEARLIYLESNQLDGMLESAGLATEPAPTRRRLPAIRRDHLIGAAVGAGIAALVMVSLIFGGLIRPGAGPNPAHSPDQPVASFLSGLNAIIGGEAAAGNRTFGAGSIPLDRGIAHLAFRNGAQIVLEGNCGFDIIDESTVVLSHGRMWAHCPKEARGFRIQLPDGREIIDLGTEFGVEVSTGGEADIHVFDGLVDVDDPHTGKKTLTAGNSLHWSDHSTPATLGTADANKFVSANALVQKRLQAYHATILARSDLLLYYDFAENGNGSTPNRVPTPATGSHGRILGGTPVAGRIQDTDALLFEHPGDAVAFELARPDSVTGLTIALWVKVDRFDTPLSTLVNSNGWDLGAIHFQASRDGNLRSGISGGTAFESPSGSVRPGQWQFLAVTWDIKARRATLYADGAILPSTRIPNSTERFSLDPQFGPAQVGSWGDPSRGGDQNLRDLKGRIDEVMIFDHALSEREIAALHRAGSP